jgi:hypothetical protein
MHHHLRLNETGLRPLEFGPIIFARIKSNPDSSLIAPMANVLEPGRIFIWPARSRSARKPLRVRLALRAGNLLTLRVIDYILRKCDDARYKTEKESKMQHRALHEYSFERIDTNLDAFKLNVSTSV